MLGVEDLTTKLLNQKYVLVYLVLMTNISSLIVTVPAKIKFFVNIFVTLICRVKIVADVFPCLIKILNRNACKGKISYLSNNPNYNFNISLSCKSNIYDWGLNEYSSGDRCEKLSKSLSKNLSYLVISAVCALILFFMISLIISAKRRNVSSKHQEKDSLKNNNHYFYVDSNKMNRDENAYDDTTQPLF
jgi:hypothetical protein